MSAPSNVSPSKNFTLRLSAADQLRLEAVAARLRLDRTGALRRLIRQAEPCLSGSGAGRFTPVFRSGKRASLPIRLRMRGER